MPVSRRVRRLSPIRRKLLLPHRTPLRRLQFNRQGTLPGQIRLLQGFLLQGLNPMLFRPGSRQVRKVLHQALHPWEVSSSSTISQIKLRAGLAMFLPALLTVLPPPMAAL
jgi:hypothetical protein